MCTYFLALLRQDNAESRESSEQAESESEDNPYHRRGIPAQEGLLWKRSLNNAERALSMTRKRLQSGRLADAGLAEEIY